MAGVKTLQAAIEAILFTMGESVELSKIAKAIEQDEQTTKELLQDLMKKYDIPTAAYETFDDPKEALAYLETAKMPIVLKADGLALGKGVLICNTLEEAKEGVKTLMLDKQFGDAGNQIVIEEFMTGREVSRIVLL